MTKVGFSNTKSLLSKAICWATRSRTSHAFLLASVEGKERVIQADWNGVVVMSWDQYQAQNNIVTLVPCAIKASDALDMANTPYDYSGFLGMVWVQFGRWIKRRWKNPIGSSKNLFCSEMVTLLLQDAGHPGVDQLDAGSTSPEDLLKFLEQP